ncbi:uncharacterized protein [Venturia canescens]|uniref:uncharacterized protein isoform X2 n=1 Tax=Venturia canescens TaxID=32260 RepID=UPI001C9C26BE|nr:uncharacterized protein LOC122416857 isoform X2 [Venturia canescens]
MTVVRWSVVEKKLNEIRITYSWYSAIIRAGRVGSVRRTRMVEGDAKLLDGATECTMKREDCHLDSRDNGPEKEKLLWKEHTSVREMNENQYMTVYNDEQLPEEEINNILKEKKLQETGSQKRTGRATGSPQTTIKDESTMTTKKMKRGNMRTLIDAKPTKKQDDDEELSTSMSELENSDYESASIHLEVSDYTSDDSFILLRCTRGKKTKIKSVMSMPRNNTNRLQNNRGYKSSHCFCNEVERQRRKLKALQTEIATLKRQLKMVRRVITRKSQIEETLKSDEENDEESDEESEGPEAIEKPPENESEINMFGEKWEYKALQLAMSSDTVGNRIAYLLRSLWPDRITRSKLILKKTNKTNTEDNILLSNKKIEVIKRMVEYLNRRKQVPMEKVYNISNYRRIVSNIIKNLRHRVKCNPRRCSLTPPPSSSCSTYPSC